MLVEESSSVIVGCRISGIGEDGTIEVCGVPLQRRPLAKLRLKAQRCRAWFSKLKRDERRLMDLVITIVEKVRSPFLASVLEPIIKRLLDTMGGIQKVMEAVIGKVAYLMKERGRSLAQYLSRIAKGWGNKSAAGWPEDKGFVQYLTVMNLPENKPP